MERQRSLYFSKVKGQISMSLGLYNEFWHLDPFGQDIARTILSGLFKLGMYTSFEKRKKPIYFARSKVKFQGQWTSIDLLVHGSVWAGYSKSYAIAVLEHCTLHMERGRSLFIFDRGGSHTGYFYSYPQPLVTLYRITFWMFCNRLFHYLRSSRRFCICILTSLGIYFHNICMF